MKKFLSLLAIAALVGCISCNSEKEKTAGETTSTEKTDNSAAEKNLAAYKTVEKAFETGDVSQIDNVVSADFITHTERGDLGRDSLKSMIIQTHKNYPDMKAETLKDLADGEYVMGMRRYSGTSHGEPGMPPKGQPYNMKSIEVVKFKDGKAVEHWAFMEMTDMMKMMAPAMGEKPKN